MVKKLWIWYLLFTKRLLKKPSFWIVLLLAPLLTAGMTLIAGEDSHVLRIAVYAEESDDKLGEQIIDDLEQLDGVVRYEACSSEEELRDLVAYGKMDAGYLIPADLSSLLEDYAAGRNNRMPYDGHLISFIAGEDTTQLQLAREQLYAALYPYLSEDIAEQFTLEQEEFEDRDEDEVRESIGELYDKLHVDESIFLFAYGEDESESHIDEANYLTAPLRGMLALFVFLTGLSTALYLLKDKQNGTFSWVRYGFGAVYDWIYLLSGTVLGGIAAYLALLCSGTFTQWPSELLLMALLVLAVTGFSGILCQAVKNLTAFATCILVIMLLSAVLCPVFLNIHMLTPVKFLLPPYFYLNGLHSVYFRLYFALYVLAAHLLYAGLHLLKAKRRPAPARQLS